MGNSCSEFSCWSLLIEIFLWPIPAQNDAPAQQFSGNSMQPACTFMTEYRRSGVHIWCLNHTQNTKAPNISDESLLGAVL